MTLAYIITVSSSTEYSHLENRSFLKFIQLLDLSSHCY